jgi:hypothetical protein
MPQLGDHQAFQREYGARVAASYGASWADVLAHAAKARSKVEFVRSHYRAAWYGIVIDRDGDHRTVRIMRDRKGNWMRKPIVMQLAARWLAPCQEWSDPDAPYNMGIPVMEVARRLDAAEETKALRIERKRLRKEWDGC